MSNRHLLTLSDLTADEIRALLARGATLGQMHRAGERHAPLPGRVLAMVFEKASTRTRLSFEAGMAQLGGHAIFLSPRDTQLGRGEPIADTARVISSMADAVMIRANEHATVEEFATVSQIPVINALTDISHPCQVLADLQTYTETVGDIAGRTVAWIGDGNNMCNTWMEAAALLGFRLHIATPPDYRPDAALLAAAGGAVELLDDPAAAAEGAAIVTTDVWASMGQETEQQARMAAFSGFQVTPAIMARAADDAVFMHCLPAHRGEEVAAEVIDGPQSVVWREAENRLHVQKALLEKLLVGQ